MHLNRRATMVAVHWLTAVLVASIFAIVLLRKTIDDDQTRLFWLDIHRSLGFLILALTLIRIGMRLNFGTISRGRHLPAPLWFAGRLTHVLIHAALIAMPLLGWAQSSAKARPFAIFGAELPPLVGDDSELAEMLGWWHEQVAYLLLALVCLHVGAALVHHFVLRDDVVRSMLPGYEPVGARRSAETQAYDLVA